MSSVARKIIGGLLIGHGIAVLFLGLFSLWSLYPYYWGIVPILIGIIILPKSKK